MKIAVNGATGVIGRAALRALTEAGHDVFGLARSGARAEVVDRLGATPVHADLFDVDSLVAFYEGCDVVCNFATHIPVGYAGMLPGAWREADRLRTEGARNVASAARTAGVRRLVQESVSFLYADNGEDWINEESPIAITRATEPASVAEAHVQEFRCGSRSGVVLRLGNIVGDDRLTRWMLKAAARGRPIGIGHPRNWAHLVHTDDLGSAVVASLSAPSGAYNVGAEPVRRGEVVQAFADASGQSSLGFVGPLVSSVAGARVEPMTRSLRVSSEEFTAQTGWTPKRGTFDTSWLTAVADVAHGSV